MSKSNFSQTPLSKEEIDEELLNNDLLNSGGMEDQENLKEMSIDDKKNLVASLSKERNQNSPHLEIRNHLSLDRSSDFPSLSEASQRPQSRLKLPRKPASSILVLSDESQDGNVTLMENEEQITKFKLPYCVRDSTPPLPMPQRPLRRNNHAYYVRPNEKPILALKRMIAHHDAWKAEYTKQISRMQAHDSEDNSDEVTNEDKTSVSKTTNDKDDSDEDPYLFKLDSSPLSSYKVLKNGSNIKNTNPCTESISQTNSRTLQRKTSRDSDCEEVDSVLKTEAPKLNEWVVTTPNRQKSKRNKKQLLHTEKNKTPVDVEFAFDNKWNPNSSSWGEQSSSSSPSLSGTLRRGIRPSPVVEEEKVQCPICQKNFGISKVENHAATCEVYSTSPMDVEEES